MDQNYLNPEQQLQVLETTFKELKNLLISGESSTSHVRIMTSLQVIANSIRMEFMSKKQVDEAKARQAIQGQKQDMEKKQVELNLVENGCSASV